MGLMDKAKKLIGKHEDKIDDSIDKAADVVDDKTGGKHTEKIEQVAEKAKDLTPDADGPDRA